MKKHGILNSELAAIIASMGHTDKLVICDAGLPIPADAVLVDLALTLNVPGFIETLRAVLYELHVERYTIALEMEKVSPGVSSQVKELLPGVKGEKIPHEDFKKYYNDSENIAFVRTGEATPYANIILQSGVTFG